MRHGTSCAGRAAALRLLGRLLLQQRPHLLLPPPQPHPAAGSSRRQLSLGRLAKQEQREGYPGLRFWLLAFDKSWLFTCCCSSFLVPASLTPPTHTHPTHPPVQLLGRVLQVEGDLHRQDGVREGGLLGPDPPPQPLHVGVPVALQGVGQGGQGALSCRRSEAMPPASQTARGIFFCPAPPLSSSLPAPSTVVLKRVPRLPTPFPCGASSSGRAGAPHLELRPAGGVPRHPLLLRRRGKRLEHAHSLHTRRLQRDKEGV